MQATVLGQNRTGIGVRETDLDLMLNAVDALSPPQAIDTTQMEAERQTYIADADSVGSIPPMVGGGKTSSSGRAKPKDLSIFLDKLGERIAFERTGTRLYDAVITKYLALVEAGHDLLPALSSDMVESDDTDAPGPAIDTLEQIRADELEHFLMLSECVRSLGGDPTAQTPCADVTAAASMGLMQVVTDPRTTLAQSLNALLTAELTDNAGWELLAELAEGAGQKEMASIFLQALETEQGHLEIVRRWLRALLTEGAGTPAV